jgi:hypothetical protein
VPAKVRTPKGRRPSFDRETLALFAKLERLALPEPAFSEGAHELARRLDLTTEYWTGNTPLDRDGPCHPSGYIANRDWETCRRVRERLLQAAGQTALDAAAIRRP